jgi:uncharacterized protein
VWDIIDDVGKLELHEIVAKHAAHWDEDRIRAAHEEIAEAQQQRDLFVTTRPAVEFYWSDDDLRARYVKNREILILNLTSRCNFACAYCANSQRATLMGAQHPDMSWDVAKKAIDQFMLDACPEHTSVTFYGGEPLLNFDVLKQCVDYVRQMEGGERIHIGLTANGYLFDDEKADFLTSRGVSITLSLDGPQSLHDRYRRTKTGEPTWTRVVNNINRYLERHRSHYESGKFGLSMVMTPPMDISELQEFFNSFCISPNFIISLSVVDTRESGFEPDGQISGFGSLRREFMENLRTGLINQEGKDVKYRIQRLLFERDLLFLHRRHQMYAVCKECGRIGLPEKYFATASCVMGTRRTFVSTDGGLWPCERIRQTPFLKIGDLENGLDMPKIRQILADWVDLTKEECQDCWCLHGCQVGCLANLSLGEKPTREEKLAACERFRRQSHENLVEYCSLLEENPHALDYMEDIKIS